MQAKEKKIINIVGARPNFMKVAPIVREMNRAGIHQILVHTGQHYDYSMSKLFFDDLGLPRPDIDLEVGSGSHARQTGEIMQRVEAVFQREEPDAVVVVGDVNSTLACALTASKLGIPVGHVEAGLRSFDRTMPEEINRVLTDALSDFLFVSEESGLQNLAKEGIGEEKVFFVGNTMIDTLLHHRERAMGSRFLKGTSLEGSSYGVLTLHRPANVDSRERLTSVLEAVNEIALEMPVIFPVHPRTVKQIECFGLSHLLSSLSENMTGGIRATDPLGYLEFLGLMAKANIVFTDSGGIQEETTVLGIPCITLRKNTERPVTLTEGTNVLAGTDSDRIVRQARNSLNGGSRSTGIPRYWDGKAAERIVGILSEELG